MNKQNYLIHSPNHVPVFMVSVNMLYETFVHLPQHHPKGILLQSTEENTLGIESADVQIQYIKFIYK